MTDDRQILNALSRIEQKLDGIERRLKDVEANVQRVKREVTS